MLRINPGITCTLVCWVSAAPLHSAAPLTIGLLVPPDGAEQAPLRQGASIAIASANKSARDPIRLAVRGRPSQWGTDGDEAAALALDDEVSGIITPRDGAAAHQVLQVAGRTRIPVVSLCSDASVTRAGVPWAMRIVPRTDEEAGVIFRAVRSSTGGKTPLRWAALVPPDRPGREIAHDLTMAAKAAGCALAEPIRIAPESPAWEARLKSIAADQPEGLLLWTEPTAAGALARRVRAAGFRGQLAGPARLCAPSFLREAKTAAEGFVLPALALDASSQAARSRFEQDYRAQFGSGPEFDALMAHDAVLLLIALGHESRESGKETRFPLRHAIQGASGLLQFDSKGNRMLTLILQVFKKGQFAPYEIAPPASQANSVSTNVATSLTGSSSTLLWSSNFHPRSPPPRLQ